MFGAGRYDIYPCSIDAGVAQQIREFCDILIDRVKGSGKQMPEVVWKHFAFRHARLSAQPLHFPPDIAPAERSATAAHENRTAFDFLPADIRFQFAP